MRDLIGHEMLLRLVRYDPISGRFTWPDGSSAEKDAKVGARGGNYMRVHLLGRSYYSHRLAWFYVNARWPREVDHIDSDPTNNAIANLRECSRSQNQANKLKYSNNSTGFKGVCKHACGKFMASIQHNRKQHYLGLYETAEQAHGAYIAAAERLHHEFARA